MTIKTNWLIQSLHVLMFLIEIKASVRTYRLEGQVGSALALPSCPSTAASPVDNSTTILFKSDSGELLSMNGILITSNPRFALRNSHLAELVISSIELSDTGQYECRTDHTIRYIVHLLAVKLSTVRLNVPEGSNVTLQCSEQGIWIVEESHRGGPIRKQYTAEFVLDNIQRNDPRFQTILCSTRDGHDRREYVIEVMYKPTVQLLLSARRRLMCVICAHPLPHRVQWWWNTRKERDDDIHQININQSCIAQQITFVLENPSLNEQLITCEAENIYGTDRDSFQLQASATRRLKYTTKKSIDTSSSSWSTAMMPMENRSSCGDRTYPALNIVVLALLYLMR